MVQRFCLVPLTISNRKTSYRSLKQTAGSTSCPWTTILVQSNLDYSKCLGPLHFLRNIGCLNFLNEYFSDMFGSFCSVLIFDCKSIKNGEKGIISTFENEAK